MFINQLFFIAKFNVFSTFVGEESLRLENATKHNSMFYCLFPSIFE